MKYMNLGGRLAWHDVTQEQVKKYVGASVFMTRAAHNMGKGHTHNFDFQRLVWTAEVQAGVFFVESLEQIVQYEPGARGSRKAGKTVIGANRMETSRSSGLQITQQIPRAGEQRGRQESLLLPKAWVRERYGPNQKVSQGLLFQRKEKCVIQLLSLSLKRTERSCFWGEEQVSHRRFFFAMKPLMGDFSLTPKRICWRTEGQVPHQGMVGVIQVWCGRINIRASPGHGECGLPEGSCQATR